MRCRVETVFMTDDETILAERSRWSVALASLPRERVTELGRAITVRYDCQPVTLPQAGLALLTLRDSVEREQFYLGEFPLSSSHIRITGEGKTVEGGAFIMADDAELASALALCDGALAHRLHGWERIAEGVRDGLNALDDEARIRKTMLERSRVNFALLNEEDEMPEQGSAE
jgi:alpha-D-ribose 1-methylphosphonate 5-triphosphate synthase subunit PhnG